MEDSLNLELQEYRKKNQQLRRKLREKDSRIQYPAFQLVNCSATLTTLQSNWPVPK